MDAVGGHPPPALSLLRGAGNGNATANHAAVMLIARPCICMLSGYRSILYFYISVSLCTTLIVSL
jgi:hypothetical protein